MFINLDYHQKQKILKYYQKEAAEYRRKKEEEKRQKRQEELNYLHQREKNQHESDIKISEENNKQKKAIMDEYMAMLQKTRNNIPGFHYNPTNKEVIINNWGKSKEEYLKENSNKNLFRKNSYNNNQSFDDYSFNKLNTIDKEKEIMRPIDSMNKYLTDEVTDKEINTYVLKQQQNKKKFYRDLLYSQFKDSALKDKNKFGTEDFLLLSEKKKKLITENPYRLKNEYGFGKSILDSNPIVNPENNIKYNKYFKNFYPELSIDKNEIENNTDINKANNIIIKSNSVKDYYNAYKNKINNQKSENNLAINGSNIMNNYKYDFSKYKIKNDDLNKNYYEILDYNKK